MVSAVAVKHTGFFNMGETSERWRPFESSQLVFTRRPAFVWDARIRVAPGLSVFVHDAYVDGEGVLKARLLGLFTVLEQLARLPTAGAWRADALLR